MTTWRHTRGNRLSAVMFSVAAMVFLLIALLADAGSEPGFVILAMVFVVVSLNTWREDDTR